MTLLISLMVIYKVATYLDFLYILITLVVAFSAVRIYIYCDVPVDKMHYSNRELELK